MVSIWLWSSQTIRIGRTSIFTRTTSKEAIQLFARVDVAHPTATVPNGVDVAAPSGGFQARGGEAAVFCGFICRERAGGGEVGVRVHLLGYTGTVSFSGWMSKASFVTTLRSEYSLRPDLEQREWTRQEAEPRRAQEHQGQLRRAVQDFVETCGLGMQPEHSFEDAKGRAAAFPDEGR